MNRLIGFLTCVSFVVLTCARECVAEPVPHAAEIVRVQVGFDGQFKIGFWTPVWVTVRGGPGEVRGRLEIITPDPEGVPVAFSSSPDDELATIPGETETKLLRYIKPGRLNEGLDVKFHIVDGGNDNALAASGAAVTSCSKSFPFRSVGTPAFSSQRLVVTFGGSIGAAESLRSLGLGESDAFVTAEVRDPAVLPDRWFGYEGVSTLVVTTSVDGLLERLTPRQVQAIDDWVRMGGRLLLCAGSRGNVVLQPKSPWHTLGPGEVVDVATLRKTAGLESYASSKRRLDADAKSGAAPRAAITVLGPVRGVVDVYEGSVGSGDRPLIVRYLHGFGHVAFVALDLDQPPLADWPGRQRLVSRIMQSLTERSLDDTDREQRSQVVHVGYDDLAGQLRSALDQFRGVTLVAFSLVAALVVAYIALIGPIDFFVLRYFGRLHWTWLTFGLVVVAFVGVAIALARATKDDRLKINQVDVVDVDLTTETSLIRGTSWSHIYSPRTAAYNLSFRPVLLADQQLPATDSGGLFSWQGLPGTGLGGLNGAPAAVLFSDPYRALPSRAEAALSQPALESLPIQISSTRSLSGRWWARAKLDARCALTSESFDGFLQGRLTNPLPVELTDCVVLYGIWAYPLDRNLPPLDEVRLTATSTYRNLEWRLTRRRVTNENKEISTPWDGESLEVPRILEMMMFHESAGGQAYTRLAHRYQAYLDLSHQLRMGRAILLGRAAEPATQLCRDGQPLTTAYEQHWTYFRVVLPVEVRTQK